MGMSVSYASVAGKCVSNVVGSKQAEKVNERKKIRMLWW